MHLVSEYEKSASGTGTSPTDIFRCEPRPEGTGQMEGVSIACDRAVSGVDPERLRD